MAAPERRERGRHRPETREVRLANPVGEVFFGDDTPWYCASCGDEIKRGQEMLAFYDEGHRVEIHRSCAPPFTDREEAPE